MKYLVSLLLLNIGTIGALHADEGKAIAEGATSAAHDEDDKPALDTAEILESLQAKVEELEKKVVLLLKDNKDQATRDACASDTSTLASGSEVAQYNQAQALYSKGEFDAALQSFHWVIENYSSHCVAQSAYYWKAMCYLKQEKYIEAKDALEKAKDKIKTSLHKIDIDLALAFIAIQFGKNKDAFELIQTCLTKDHLSDKQKIEAKEMMDTLHEKDPVTFPHPPVKMKGTMKAA